MELFRNYLFALLVFFPLTTSATLIFSELPVDSTFLTAGDMFAVPAYDNLQVFPSTGPPPRLPVTFSSIDSIKFAFILGNVSEGINEVEFVTFEQIINFGPEDFFLELTDPTHTSRFLDGWEPFTMTVNTTRDGFGILGIDMNIYGELGTPPLSVPEPSIALLMVSGLIAFGVVRRKARK